MGSKHIKRRCRREDEKMKELETEMWGPSYLAKAMERPEVLRKVVRDYTGAYSLGITRLPGTEDDYAFLLRVEDEHPMGLPDEVTVNGHRIRVIVKGGFRQPSALKYG